MSHLEQGLGDRAEQSARRTLQDMIHSRMGRRQMLGGSLGLAATGLLGASIASCGQDTPKPAATDMTRGKLTPNFSDTISTLPSAALLAFTSVPAILDQTFDAVAVPPGYAARPFFSWGDPVVAGAPSWQADASQTADDQQLQAGQSHDGMVYFPMKDKPDHGLLAVNHEDLEPLTLHPSGPTIDSSGLRPLAEVRKELAALGVSIIEVRKNAAGAWERVTDSPYGRRITGTTPMDITGPVPLVILRCGRLQTPRVAGCWAL